MISLEIPTSHFNMQQGYYPVLRRDIREWCEENLSAPPWLIVPERDFYGTNPYRIDLANHDDVVLYRMKWF